MFHSVSLPGRGELERPVSCGGGVPGVCVCAWEQAQGWAGPRRGCPGSSPRQRVRSGLRLRGQRSPGRAGAGGRLSSRPGSPAAPALGRQPPARSVRGPWSLSGVGRGWGSRGGRSRLPGLPPTGTRRAHRAGAAPAPAPSAPPAEPGLSPRRLSRPPPRSSRAVRGRGCPRAGRCPAPRASEARHGPHGRGAPDARGGPSSPAAEGLGHHWGRCWGAVWGRLLSMKAVPLLLFYSHPAAGWGQD